MKKFKVPKISKNQEIRDGLVNWMKFLFLLDKHHDVDLFVDGDEEKGFCLKIKKNNTVTILNRYKNFVPMMFRTSEEAISYGKTITGIVPKDRTKKIAMAS